MKIGRDMTFAGGHIVLPMKFPYFDGGPLENFIKNLK